MTCQSFQFGRDTASLGLISERSAQDSADSGLEMPIDSTNHEFFLSSIRRSAFSCSSVAVSQSPIPIFAFAAWTFSALSLVSKYFFADPDVSFSGPSSSSQFFLSFQKSRFGMSSFVNSDSAAC